MTAQRPPLLSATQYLAVAFAIAVTITAAVAAPPYPASVALATVATTYPELVAARTALLSARRNAHLPANTSFVLLTSSEIAPNVVDAVVKADAITHHPLPHSLALRAPSRLIPLFALNYDRLIYITPYSLVVSTLAPILSCQFCAAVNKPCAFSTNLLVLTPDPALHQQLLHSSRSSSSNISRLCDDHPEPEACILNFHIPLDDAPLFPSSSQPPPPAMRLAPAIITPHYLYYPRMRWELPSDQCGIQAIIDFSSPSFTRPTNIITLILLRLNRQWYHYRSQLHHVDTDSIFVEAAIVFAFLSATVAVYVRSLQTLPPSTAKHRRSLSIPPIVPHDLLIFFWLATCSTLNALTWLLSVHVSQSCSSVPLAVLILLLNKILCSSAAYTALGAFFMRFATADDADGALLHTGITHRAPVVTAMLNVLEAAVVGTLVYVINVLPAETGFRRLVWLFLAVAVYFLFWLYVAIVLFCMWLSAAATSPKMDRTRS